MSLGKDWHVAVIARNVSSEKERIESAARDGQVEAITVISEIPKRIEKAAKKGKRSIVLLPRRLKSKDTTHRSVGRLVDADYRRRGMLREEDLMGAARTIFAWCHKNDLECFLKYTGRRRNKCQLRAKPRIQTT